MEVTQMTNEAEPRSGASWRHVLDHWALALWVAVLALGILVGSVR